MAVLLNDYGEYRGNKEIYNVLWEGNYLSLRERCS
jgi:hypothetical protein